MADIPVANITEKHLNVSGNVKVWSAKVKGDGSGVTVPIPMTGVFNVLTGNIDDSSAIPGISFASGVLTYASAPTINKYHYVRVEGY